MSLSVNSPIGILDSGAGGLSVLRHIHTLLPDETLFYTADSAHLPYSDKSSAYIRGRVNALAAALVDLGIKALVVACNTATAAAVESLRERYTIPVVGMEPGVKPAVLSSKSGVVGLLATAAMVNSNRMADLVQRYAGEYDLIIQPCPGLVEQVERHALETAETSRLLQQYLAPILGRGADALVLGCTHYPFLRPLIEHLVGPKVAVIDTAEAVANRLQSLLQQEGFLNPHSNQSSIRFFSTAPTTAQAELFSNLLGWSVVVEPLVERIEV